MFFSGALKHESTGGTGQTAMTPGSLLIKLQMLMILTSHPEVSSTPIPLEHMCTMLLSCRNESANVWCVCVGPRKVYLRWLVDSRRFNEWMNPVDYETEEYQKEQDVLEQNQTTASRSRHGDGTETAGNKRKFSPGREGGTKRAAPRQRIDPGVMALLLHRSELL